MLNIDEGKQRAVKQAANWALFVAMATNLIGLLACLAALVLTIGFAVTYGKASHFEVISQAQAIATTFTMGVLLLGFGALLNLFSKWAAATIAD